MCGALGGDDCRGVTSGRRALHVEPLFVDVRYSYSRKTRIVSAAFVAEIVSEADADQLVEPPETVGVGRERAVELHGALHPGGRVARRVVTARNCTTVCPARSR
jgi:hypothetical protein